jgi:hypothetical protein
MAINGRARFYLRALHTLAPAGDAGGGAVGEVVIDKWFASGTGDNQIDKPFYDVRTVSSSSNEDLDLTTITDENGVALAAAEVALVVIVASDDNTVDLTFSFDDANGWNSMVTGDIVLGAGEFFVLGAPKNGGPAVSGSVKLINAAAGAADSTYTVLVWARSA